MVDKAKTFEETFGERNVEAEKLRRDYSLELLILGALILFAAGYFFGRAQYGGESPSVNDGYQLNLYTEGLGVIVTVVLVSLVNHLFKIRDLKKQLVNRAGSTFRDRALDAIEDLRENEWLTSDNGLLKKANLVGAKLEGANLELANLPDGTQYSNNVDLGRFTNVVHPDFAVTRQKIHKIRKEIRKRKES